MRIEKLFTNNSFFFSKEKLEEDNQALREQILQLKIDFENSESVQHDFVKLSQALQVIELNEERLDFYL